ncbi:MAG: F0F1 ATP synthase subunit B [Kiloniellales bacterium]|nr:F0F1 ATP synthase subunit B [Kiloniellales bacterium]
MFSDPTFWTAVAFAIIMLAIGGRAFRFVTSSLDKRAEEIRRQLDEAEALRVEAQKMLADHKRKQRDAEKEAEEMLAHARAESQRMREKAQQDLEADLKQREQVALDKIAQAEANALKDIRGQAVELAVAATAKLLSENLDKATADDLVQSAIDGLDERLQ